MCRTRLILEDLHADGQLVRGREEVGRQSRGKASGSFPLQGQTSLSLVSQNRVATMQGEGKIDAGSSSALSSFRNCWDAVLMITPPQKGHTYSLLPVPLTHHLH